MNHRRLTAAFLAIAALPFTSPAAPNSISVTASIPTPTYAGQIYNISGHAQYTALPMPVMGGTVNIALLSSNYTGYTDTSGNYSIPIAPLNVGVCTARVTVTDASLTGTNFLTITVVTTDQDADNMPDSWEQGIVDADLLDGITNVNDVLPGADFDGDHACNRDEWLAGTQATNTADYLGSSVDGSSGAPVLQWPSYTGCSYKVLSTTHLVENTWVTNADSGRGTGSNMTYSVTNTDPAVYYSIQAAHL